MDAKDNRFYREPALIDGARAVQIDYTNHAGVRQLRRIVPDAAGIFFSSSPWHPEPEWLLNAYDLGKSDLRTFAVSSIHSWQPDDSRGARADVSLAKQLQASIERNGRVVKRIRSEAFERQLAAIGDPRIAISIRANLERILNDSEPV